MNINFNKLSDEQVERLSIYLGDSFIVDIFNNIIKADKISSSNDYELMKHHFNETHKETFPSEKLGKLIDFLKKLNSELSLVDVETMITKEMLNKFEFLLTELQYKKETEVRMRDIYIIFFNIRRCIKCCKDNDEH